MASAHHVSLAAPMPTTLLLTRQPLAACAGLRRPPTKSSVPAASGCRRGRACRACRAASAARRPASVFRGPAPPPYALGPAFERVHRGPEQLGREIAAGQLAPQPAPAIAEPRLDGPARGADHLGDLAD